MIKNYNKIRHLVTPLSISLEDVTSAKGFRNSICHKSFQFSISSPRKGPIDTILTQHRHISTEHSKHVCFCFSFPFITFSSWKLCNESERRVPLNLKGGECKKIMFRLGKKLEPEWMCANNVHRQPVTRGTCSPSRA